jgi:hypothetical protein
MVDRCDKLVIVPNTGITIEFRAIAMARQINNNEALPLFFTAFIMKFYPRKDPITTQIPQNNAY